MILWRRHARIEAENDNISESCLEDALRGGFRIVEFYPDMYQNQTNGTRHLQRGEGDEL